MRMLPLCDEMRGVTELRCIAGHHRIKQCRRRFWGPSADSAGAEAPAKSELWASDYTVTRASLRTSARRATPTAAKPMIIRETKPTVIACRIAP